MEIEKRINQLALNISQSQKMLVVLGDESRQHIIIEMLKMKGCNGVRVMEITKQTNLSRPAVSHHLQILKQAGILKVRKEGTMNFYYFDADMVAFEKLIQTLSEARDIMLELPDRSVKE